MTKLRIAIGGAAVAAAFVLPASPAQAATECRYVGTFVEICLPSSGS